MPKILRSMGTLLPCTGGTIWRHWRKVDDDDVQIVEAADLRHSRPPSVGHRLMASNNRRDNLAGYRLTAIICYRSPYVNPLFGKIFDQRQNPKIVPKSMCADGAVLMWPCRNEARRTTIRYVAQTALALHIPGAISDPLTRSMLNGRLRSRCKPLAADGHDAWSVHITKGD